MEWISVDDEMPKVNQVVIIGWDHIYISTPMAVWTGTRFIRYIDKAPEDRIIVLEYSNVTHWMHLPKQPKKKR